MDTQTRTSGAHTATLGLGSVLVGSLPAALMTDHAPDRYTVEAVFTRRPERDEVTEILGSRTRDYLAKAGFPTVELSVSDRRLEIANTNLEELRDGLAMVIADRLASISGAVQERLDAAAARFQEAATTEVTRAAAVAALAESVTFDSSVSPERTPAAALSASDGAQLTDWAGEGGHARSSRG